MDSQLEESLIGYVLGLLDPDEQQAVEIQISKSPAVREELQALQQQVHQLALVAPLINPAPATRQALLARVGATKRKALPRGRVQPRASLAWAVALVLFVALGGWNIGLRNENAQLKANNSALNRNLDDERLIRTRMAERVANADIAVEFLVSANTTSRSLAPTTTAPSAKGTMYMQPGKNTAVLVVDGLEPLPEDRTYQFWLARDNGVPIPSDTFKVDAAGHAQVVIQADAQVNDFKQVMITIEPAAGSALPSDGATVLQGNL
jgi:anti-sigma-K factor RskA